MRPPPGDAGTRNCGASRPAASRRASRSASNRSLRESFGFRKPSVSESRPFLNAVRQAETASRGTRPESALAAQPAAGSSASSRRSA